MTLTPSCDGIFNKVNVPVVIEPCDEEGVEEWGVAAFAGKYCENVIFTFEQYIPVMLINSHKYNCIRGYTV
jgi:hypothetical protein